MRTTLLAIVALTLTACGHMRIAETTETTATVCGTSVSEETWMEIATDACGGQKPKSVIKSFQNREIAGFYYGSAYYENEQCYIYRCRGEAAKPPSTSRQPSGD